MLMRLGVNRTIVTDDWKSPEFASAVKDWAAAAYTVRRLSSVKAAVFNKLYGMGDILGDEAAFYRKFGIEINYESIGLIVKAFEEVTDAEVDAYIAEDKKNFEIDPCLSAETHRYASRMQAAFEKFLDSKGYEAFSQNINVYVDDGMRLKQLPILGACNMLAKGYGYSAEGDVHSLALTIIGHLLIGDPHFTEMYSLDFGRDSALMSHMGEGNWKVARKDRKVRLVDRPLTIGGAEDPPTPLFSAQPGEATIASLIAVAGDDYKIMVSHGEILDTEDIQGIPMNYTFFKPDAGIKQSMDNWLKYGGTHHQVLWLGDQRRKLRYFCDISGIGYIEV
jgi:L-arabinose isomerase